MQPNRDEPTDLFRLLVESVRDYAIFLLDVGGHIRSWNAGAQRLKGYDASEIIGKHFSINMMIAKDSVRSRMEGDNGISYTEFSYMLLQAHDFYHLRRTCDCELQIGGSDQWGNITAGTDLIRKKLGVPA